LSDHTDVYDLYVANRASALIVVGVRLGLFDALAEPHSLADITQRFELSPRGVSALVTGLHALHLVRPTPAGWVRTDRAASTLSSAPGSLAGLIDIDFEHFITPAGLLDAMRTGEMRAYGDADVWRTHAADPAMAARFTAAMHSISQRPADALADQTEELGACRTLLDVGGGSGIYLLAALRRWPQLHGTVLDLPTVIPETRRVLDEGGVGDRGHAIGGDMFEPLPQGHDAILYAQILHDWPEEACARLLARAYEALPPGGVVLVSEKLLAEDRSGPWATAMVDIDMLFWTEGRQCDVGQVRELLRVAGFVDVETRPSVDYWSVVVGRKAPRAPR